MNKRKIIDYIQILFWICVLVAGATGAFFFSKFGYIDWVVIGQTVLVFINAFGWTVLIREKLKGETNPMGAGTCLLFPILIIFIYLNENLQGWNTGISITGRNAMFVLIFIFVFIASIIKMRYGIIATLSFSTMFFLIDNHCAFDILEYIEIFLSLISISIGSLSLKFIAEKIIFRRWSDVLVKQESQMDQK